VRISLILFLSAVVLLGAGCADFKSYMRDRGNDLADCFTLRAGWEYGLAVRTQTSDYIVVSAGASHNDIEEGYFGRTPVKVCSSWRIGVPVFQILLPFALVACPLAGLTGAFLPEKADMEWYEPFEFLLIPLVSDLMIDVRRCPNQRSSILGLNVGAIGLAETAEEGMLIHWKKEQPYIRKRFFIEVGACVGFVGFDVGFNPVEFVDFLLGWTTLDMAGDDTWKKAPPGTESPEQPAP
jgi:hypothetical protein